MEYNYIIIIKAFKYLNAMVLGKELDLLCANGSQFEMHQLLFADDTPLVGDSEKLCRLVSEFGRVCKTRNWRVNVSKSNIKK